VGAEKAVDAEMALDAKKAVSAQKAVRRNEFFSNNARQGSPRLCSPVFRIKNLNI
jgi:hypothetical protein